MNALPIRARAAPSGLSALLALLSFAPGLPASLAAAQSRPASVAITDGTSNTMMVGVIVTAPPVPHR